MNMLARRCRGYAQWERLKTSPLSDSDRIQKLGHEVVNQQLSEGEGEKVGG